MPETSLAGRARGLVARSRVGTLSTHSRKFPGFPFGSLMPFAADTLGRPIFFVSSLAMHTRNLQHDPRASLLLTPPEVSGDPLGAARVTLLGNAVAAPAVEVRDLYLSEGVKKSKAAGETACATDATPLFPRVGQAVSPASAARGRFFHTFSHHENAGSWQDFGDFAYYRLDVSAVYFIGGFGVMGWISAADYTSAQPDPSPAT